MIFPPALKSGDKIGIVAPGKSVKKEDIDFAIDTFQRLGFSVVAGENLYKSSIYLSASDNLRLQDLQSMCDDNSIRAVICARGGYGTTRILDRLDLSALKRNPKWIVGFSDITALHLKLVSAEIASIHGTMPVMFRRSDSQSSIQSLASTLFGNPIDISFEANSFNRDGTVYGEIIGGNLSLIVDSLGTRSEPDTTGKILFIEEIDEYLYKIDRMMTQLKRAGKLQGLQGLVVGHMTDANDTDLPFGMSVEQIVIDAVKGYSFPIAFGFPSGHQNPNLSWIHGQRVALTVTPSEGHVASADIRENIL